MAGTVMSDCYWHFNKVLDRIEGFALELQAAMTATQNQGFGGGGRNTYSRQWLPNFAAH